MHSAISGTVIPGGQVLLEYSKYSDDTAINTWPGKRQKQRKVFRSDWHEILRKWANWEKRDWLHELESGNRDKVHSSEECYIRCLDTGSHTCIHKYTHKHTPKHPQNHTHTHRNTHKNTYTNIHTQTHTNSHANTHSCNKAARITNRHLGHKIKE